MKTEILAAYNETQAKLTVLGELIDSIPNDPTPPAPTPTGLRVVGSYGTNPLAIQIAWDFDYPSIPVLLEMKGAEGNPAGPTDWYPQPYNGSGPDNTGTMFLFVLQNPAGQKIMFRVRYLNTENSPGESCEITVNADDYLPQ